MAHRRLRSIRRAAGARQHEQQAAANVEEREHPTRDWLPNEAENSLIAAGLLPGNKKRAQAKQARTLEEHGKPKKSGLMQINESPMDCLNRLGIGEKTGTRRIERGDDF